MKIQPFLDRLSGLGFVELGGPIEWAGLKMVPRLPAAFVVPDDEAAGANGLGDTVGAIDQLVQFGFAVNIVLQGAARATGKIEENLHDTVAAVKGRLLGWRHPEAVRPVSYVGGRLLVADGVQLTWAARFRTAYRERKVG